MKTLTQEDIDKKAKDTELTELQMAQALLGYSLYKTKKIVREYLEILDKNCKYTS